MFHSLNIVLLIKFVNLSWSYKNIHLTNWKFIYNRSFEKLGDRNKTYVLNWKTHPILIKHIDLIK